MESTPTLLAAGGALASLAFVHARHRHACAAAARVPAASEDFYNHVNKSWLDDPANAIPAEYVLRRTRARRMRSPRSPHALSPPHHHTHSYPNIHSHAA